MQLQGADLSLTQLQGASLGGAQLQGAWLFATQLQGADLSNAGLDGAYLEDAQLQGAQLEGAQLQSVALYGAFLWRTTANSSVKNVSPLGEIHWGPFWVAGPLPTNPEPWTGTAYATLRQSLEREVPGGISRDLALGRVSILDCAKRADNLASCDSSANLPNVVQQWKKSIEYASIDSYAKALLPVLGDLICSGESNSTYVLRGLLRHHHFRLIGSEEMRALVKRITSAECPLSIALTDADKRDIAAALNELAK